MKFYKYAPWMGEKGTYTRENLLENAVYLASPETFNDPHDFNPGYTYNENVDKRIIHLTRLFEEKEGLPKKQARSKAKQTLLNNPRFNSEENISEFAKDIKENLRRFTGVSCFTTKPGNSPMWERYADGYAGICMEWDFPYEEKENFSLPQGVENQVPLILQPVNYSNKRFVSDIFDDKKESPEPLYNSVITKSTDWMYENEYRLIQPGYTGKVYYDPCRLSGIIIGYKASEEQIQEVKDFVKKMKWQPRIYKAILNEKNVEYDMVQLF